MLEKVRAVAFLVTVVGSALLSACGGGSGGGDPAPANTSTRTATPTNAPPATTTSTPAPTSTPTAPVPTPTSTQAPTFSPSPTITALDPQPTPTAIGGGASTPTEMPCPPTATAVPTSTAIPTPTEAPIIGPEVTALGIADATGSPITAAGSSGGIPAYQVQFGSGFILFVEGRPGVTGLAVGSLTNNRSPFDPSVRPDLQIEVDRDLGDGSPASCDNSAPDLGGVPAVVPAGFEPTQGISDALNDLSCRFSTFDESQFPCTQDGTGNFAFVDANTTRQFCVLISTAIAFKTGETTVTARLRDSGGNAGPVATMIVRVVH